MSDETRTMARALAAWAAQQPVGMDSRESGNDDQESVNPWQSAGQRRLP